MGEISFGLEMSRNFEQFKFQAASKIISAARGKQVASIAVCIESVESLSHDNDEYIAIIDILCGFSDAF